jgi:hypothetical protein
MLPRHRRCIDAGRDTGWGPALVATLGGAYEAERSVLEPCPHE